MPRGNYYIQLEELYIKCLEILRVSVVCETFLSCISLVAQSDFLSVHPAELSNDPLLAHRLKRADVGESLSQVTYYLNQRRDTTSAPLTAALMNPFRRQCR